MGRSAVEGDALGEVDAGGAAPEGGDAELGFGAKAIVATLAFFSLMAVIVAPVIFARGFALARHVFAMFVVVAVGYAVVWISR